MRMIIALITFLLIATSVSAYNPNSIVLSQVGAFDSSVVVGVDNNMDKGVRHLKVTAIIPELGVRYRVGPFNLDEGKETMKRLLLDIPEDASGEYVVRVVVNDGGIRRVRHRFVTLP